MPGCRSYFDKGDALSLNTIKQCNKNLRKDKCLVCKCGAVLEEFQSQSYMIKSYIGN